MEIMSFQQFKEEFLRAYNSVDIYRVKAFLDVMMTAFHEEQIIYTLGNGGSGAAASHLCEDIGKGTLPNMGMEKRFKVLSLADNTPYILAWANDEGYETIFEQQLRNFAKPRDVVIGISGSGNSANVLNAVRYANRQGLITVGFTGFDGGELGRLVDHHVHVACDDMGIVESVHGTLMHYIVIELKNRLKTLSMEE